MHLFHDWQDPFYIYCLNNSYSNCWIDLALGTEEAQSSCELMHEFVGWHLHLVFCQNGVCICSCRIKNKSNAVHWPLLGIYSCWRIVRYKIYNIRAAFCVFIECVNLWFLSFIFCYIDVIMQSMSTRPHSSFHFSFYLCTIHSSFYKQPSWWGSNVKNGLKVKELAKQPSMLLQKSLVELCVNNLTFLIS